MTRAPWPHALAVAILALLCALAAGAPANAHQTTLSIVEATEVQPGRFMLNWRNRPTSARGDAFVEVGPVWPGHCTLDWPLLDCGERGLQGVVGFEGLGVAQSAAMIRVEPLEGGAQVVTLTPTADTARLTPSLEGAGLAAIARAYVALGVEHILIGIDHLLFVLGLMWIARGRWALVRTITAFTVAHSVTLAAVSLGWLTVPEAFVNAMIALSIVFVGVEIMRRERGLDSVTLRRPWLVAFGFGLLHGFGFANALVEMGLPDGARLMALAAFNIGVEIGQLAFVALTLALLWAWRRMQAPAPARGGPPVAYAVSGLAAFWFFDRVAILIGN